MAVAIWVPDSSSIASHGSLSRKRLRRCARATLTCGVPIRQRVPNRESRTVPLWSGPSVSAVLTLGRSSEAGGMPRGRRAAKLFERLFGEGAVVASQSPVQLDDYSGEMGTAE